MAYPERAPNATPDGGRPDGIWLNTGAKKAEGGYPPATGFATGGLIMKNAMSRPSSDNPAT